MIGQGNLFGKSTTEKNSVEYLRDLGYVVEPPDEFIEKGIKDYSGIKTSAALVKFFYNRLKFYNPKRRMHYSRSSVDQKLATLFIKARTETGIGRKRAIFECACIIDTLLKYEHVFNLSSPVSSLKILGQNKMKWLTDRVICIINKENSVEADLIERKEMEEMIRQWGKEDYGINC